MNNLELALIIYIIVSQIVLGIRLFFIPRNSKINIIATILINILFPIILGISLIDDLIRHIKRKKEKDNE